MELTEEQFNEKYAKHEPKMFENYLSTIRMRMDLPLMRVFLIKKKNEHTIIQRKKSKFFQSSKIWVTKKYSYL